MELRFRVFGARPQGRESTRTERARGPRAASAARRRMDAGGVRQHL